MTAESAGAFWARVKQDGEFRSKLAAAATEQELEQIIREAGFVFTAEDLQASLQEWKQTSVEGKELSEAELGAVAGGSIAFTKLLGSLSFFDRQFLTSQIGPSPLFKG